MVSKTKTRIKTILQLIFVVSLITITTTDNTFAQSSDEAIRTQVQGNEVYIYHTMNIREGYGFNIYRSEGGDFELLNNEPILGATDMNDFIGKIGEHVDDLQTALELETPQALYLRLRASRMAANLVSFYYPDVASALARLYIDESAPIGSTVTYKVEMVDRAGEKTGDTIEQQVDLKETIAPKPSGLKAEHEGEKITIKWNYPTSDAENDDKIVRFNIYDKQGDDLRRINDEPIIRINNFDEFEYIFTETREGATLNLIVAPVSLTQKELSISDPLEFTITDNIAPAIIADVETLPNENGEVEIVWPVSPEVDAVGYNIYRADRIKGNYKKINDELIPVLDNFYVDRPDTLQKSYFYSITAVDEAGNESKRSNAVKADLEDHTLPEAPTSFTATALEDGNVLLEWEEGVKKHNFQTYVILRNRLEEGLGKAVSQVNIEDLNDNKFIDEGEAEFGFTEGAYYKYSIMAMDSARNVSEQIDAIIQIPDRTPPETPTSLIVENDNGIRTILRWNASTSTDVGEYKIYKGTNSDNLELYKNVSVNDRIFRDDSVKVGQNYYYAVSAEDTLGNESEKGQTVEVSVKDFTPPRSVRNVRAEAESDNSDITITWEPVNSKDLAGYKIYYSTSPSGIYELLTEEVITETEYVATNLDSSYWIQVKAIDSSGNESKKSNSARIYISGQSR